MSQDDEISPEEEAAFERLRARRPIKLDPVTMGILNRATELARREDCQTATLKHLLEVLLHATITPALINHLQASRSICEDEHGNEVVYVDDLCVLAAQLADGGLVWQALERHVDDMDALTSEVRAFIRDNDGRAP